MQSHHALCQTDPIKLQLLRLWEESLYQEFIAARSHGPNGEAREVRERYINHRGNVSSIRHPEGEWETSPVVLSQGFCLLESQKYIQKIY